MIHNAQQTCSRGPSKNKACLGVWCGPDVWQVTSATIDSNHKFQLEFRWLTVNNFGIAARSLP